MNQEELIITRSEVDHMAEIKAKARMAQEQAQRAIKNILLIGGLAFIGWLMLVSAGIVTWTP